MECQPNQCPPADEAHCALHYSFKQSRLHVLEDPVHVVPDGGEDGGDADAALLGAEGDDAAEEHGAVDAARARYERAAAVTVARVTIWRGSQRCLYTTLATFLTLLGLLPLVLKFMPCTSLHIQCDPSRR